MLEITLNLAQVVLMLSAALCLARLIKGPSLADRLLAQDTLSIHLVAIMTMASFKVSNKIFLDAALLIALFSFISTLVAAKFIAKGQIIAREQINARELINAKELIND